MNDSDDSKIGIVPKLAISSESSYWMLVPGRNGGGKVSFPLLVARFKDMNLTLLQVVFPAMMAKLICHSVKPTPKEHTRHKTQGKVPSQWCFNFLSVTVTKSELLIALFNNLPDKPIFLWPS